MGLLYDMWSSTHHTEVIEPDVFIGFVSYEDFHIACLTNVEIFCQFLMLVSGFFAEYFLAHLIAVAVPIPDSLCSRDRLYKAFIRYVSGASIFWSSLAKRSTNWNGVNGLNFPERVTTPRSVSTFSAAEAGRSEALFSLSSLLDYSSIAIDLLPSSIRNVFDSGQGVHDTPRLRGV